MSANGCKTARFRVGDLLLLPPEGVVAEMLPGIMPVHRVDKVGSRFYSMTSPFSAFGTHRRTIEITDRVAVSIPAHIPWQFPDGFCALCHSSRAAYLSRLWCVDEVGNPVGRNFQFYADWVCRKPVERQPQLGFRPCGYSIRVFQEGQPVRWMWANTPLHVLRKLTDLAVEAEADLPVSDPFPPNHLSEKQLLRWDYLSLAGASQQLRPGDAFCTLGHGEICFSTFQRYTRSGKIATGGRGYGGIDPAEIRQVPTAFPPEIMAAIGCFYCCLSFYDSDIEAIGGHPSLEAADWVWDRVSDVPGGPTGAAYRAASMGTAALYYTNDRIHWWRRLSDALNREIERLSLIFKEGHSRPQ